MTDASTYAPARVWKWASESGGRFASINRQMGSAPYLGGHFYAYAPEKFEYPINRYTMEVMRQLDVLDRDLAERRILAGDEYTIADMATCTRYGALGLHNLYDAEARPRREVVRERGALGERDRGAGRRSARAASEPRGPEELRVPRRQSARDLDVP